MDVRLYPSAPAVGARPGAEPASLAPLDYYHCGKVGGGGVGAREGGACPRLRTQSRARAPRAGARAAVPQRLGTRALSGTHAGRCRRCRRAGTRTHQPRRRAHATHADPLAVTLTPRVVGITGRSHPDSHSHDVTVTHTHPRPPDSLACIHKPTHSDPLSHTQPSCLHSRPTQVTLTVIYFYTATRSHSPTCAATPPHASHPVPHYDATHRVPCPHPPSHAVTTGDRHTKKSLRQSLAHAPSDSRQSHAVTHSHPMDGEPQAP